MQIALKSLSNTPSSSYMIEGMLDSHKLKFVRFNDQ